MNGPVHENVFLSDWPVEVRPGSTNEFGLFRVSTISKARWLHGPDNNAGAEAGGNARSTNAAPSESLFSKDYWKLVAQDVKETFTAPAHWDTGDWLIAGGVAAGIGVTAAFDREIRDAVQRNRNSTVDSVFNAVEPLGAEYSFGLLGAFYVGGEVFKNSNAKATALDGLSASIIASGLINLPLKYTVGRSRPDKGQGPYHFAPFSGNDSFASGHTTQAFAVASVIAEHYDSLWIKMGSYGLASMVGYARLNNDAHWASDVLAGAAIGTCVGHIVVNFNQRHRNASIRPVVGPRMIGAEFSLAF
jgi:membrane-associated phospholipid phosphatase